MAKRPGRAAAMLAGLALLAACSGDRPGSPTPTSSSRPPQGIAAGAALTVTRGDTGAPVAGATVTLEGATYITDAEGRFRTAQAAAPAAFLDVTAAGMLDRRTTVGRTPIDTIVLWPRETPTGVDESFTATVVYTAGVTGTVPFAGDPLRRIPAEARTAYIVLTPDILADEFAHAAHVEGVARLNAAARGAVTFELTPVVPSAWPIFTARIAPEDATCADRRLAFVRYSVRGSDIVGGEIIYCSRVAPHRLALVVHELGHVFGLQHSTDPRDMMFPTLNAAHADDFRPREVEVMSLMMHRRSGNRFPDSDVGLPTAAAVSETVIVCR